MSDQQSSPQERLAWQGAALALGEKLADVGPNGYYSMSPAEWMTWCSARIIDLQRELNAARSAIGAQRPSVVRLADVIAIINEPQDLMWPSSQEWLCEKLNALVAATDRNAD